MQAYNPIVRTFNRIRAVLSRDLDVARRHICPEMPLEMLIPVEQRRQVWRDLRAAGLDVPFLELSKKVATTNTLVSLKTAVSLALGLKAWAALFAFLPLQLLAFGASRPLAVHIPPVVRTVGDLVIYLTRFREHNQSGYRWTRNEISTKVRMIVAEAAGRSLEEVQPETNWSDLGLN